MKPIKKLIYCSSNKSSIVFFIGSLFIYFLLTMILSVNNGIAKEIAGYIKTSSGNGIRDVIVTFENIGSTTTRADGYYSRGIPNGWSGTVTPTKGSYTFEPVSRSYSNVTSNFRNQNYTGSLVVQQKVKISGYVRTSSGSGIEDVILSFNNGGGTAETNQSGYYSQYLDKGWSGTVTPSKGGYSFGPASRRYVNIIFNQSNEDYIGTQDQSESSSNPEVRSDEADEADEGDEGYEGYGCFVRCLD